LSHTCPTVEVGENEYHDVEFNLTKKAPLTETSTYEDHKAIWEYITDAVGEHRVFTVVSYNQAVVPVAFAIMLQSAGDYLVKTIEKGKDWQNNSLSMKSMLSRQISGQLSKGQRFAAIEDDVRFGLEMISYDINNLDGLGISNVRQSNIQDNSSEITHILKKQYITVEDFSQPINDSCLAELHTLLYSRLQFHYINAGLDNVNIKYSPMVYASQDYDNAVGREYLKLVKFVAAEVKKDIDAENDEYEDDEDDEDNEA
jgi:hypothetical protein